jgi:hypothetical protein
VSAEGTQARAEGLESLALDAGDDDGDASRVLEAGALDAGDDGGDASRVLEAGALAWGARPGSEPQAVANTTPTRMAATNPSDLID